MQPIDKTILHQGLTYDTYRRRVERNGEIFDEVYRTPAFGGQDLELLAQLPPLTLMALCEDWCPDVYHTLPTWARLVQELDGWELRIFPSDLHPELMPPFLHRGKAKRIPVYIFLDSRGYPQVWWSGRGAVAQEQLDGFLAGRIFSALSAEEREVLGRRVDEAYRRDLRRRNFREMLDLLRAFYHLP